MESENGVAKNLARAVAGTPLAQSAPTCSVQQYSCFLPILEG